MERKQVYVKADVITSPDRMNDCIIAVKTTSGRVNEVECSNYHN